MDSVSFVDLLQAALNHPGNRRGSQVAPAVLMPSGKKVPKEERKMLERQSSHSIVPICTVAAKVCQTANALESELSLHHSHINSMS